MEASMGKRVEIRVTGAEFMPGEFGRGSAGTYRIEAETATGERYVIFTSSEKWYGARAGWTGEVSWTPGCEGSVDEQGRQYVAGSRTYRCRVSTIRVTPPGSSGMGAQ
jgi:hypothetical protein